MENASKALIIAASVILGVLLFSLMIMMFRRAALVDQNYEMPVEYLKSIGIEVVFPDFASADIEEADFENADYEEADYGKLETIEFHELKRGIIGVNKIGYVMAS